MNYFETLETLLKSEAAFCDKQGILIKEKVIEEANKYNPLLIDLLLSNKALKEEFFVKAAGTYIFKIDRFMNILKNKAFLPDSYTAFQNKIGFNITKEINSFVCLDFPYKDCYLEGGQTKEEGKRNEVFFNTILAKNQIHKLLEPKAFINGKRISQKGESKLDAFQEDGSLIKDNLLIKGNNLLALHSLKKRFAGRVKLIYIDPPYNTGGEANTFAYNNDFNHSSWLVFMKNRLEVAKEFLTEDGFIAIAIDHFELYYLGVLADEIFGRENRVGLVTVLHNPKGRNLAKFFSANSEYMLVYAKNIESTEFNEVALDDDIKASFEFSDEQGSFRYEPYLRSRTVWSRANKPNNWYPIYVSDDLKTITFHKIEGYHEIYPIANTGKEMAWKNIKESSIDHITKDKEYFIAKRENNKIIIYHKLREQQVYKNVWTDKKYQSEFNGTNVLKALIGKNRFSYPKSVFLVQDIIKLTSDKDSYILDFFGGSGTTAHAVLELNKQDKGNRKFIIIEQMDYIEDVTKERIKAVLKTENLSEDFVYLELASYNQNYIDMLGKAKNTVELLSVYEEIKKNAFVHYLFDFKDFENQMDGFKTLALAEQKKIPLRNP